MAALFRFGDGDQVQHCSRMLGAYKFLSFFPLGGNMAALFRFGDGDQVQH